MGVTAQTQSGSVGQSDDRVAIWTTVTASFHLNYKFLPNVHGDGWLLDL